MEDMQLEKLPYIHEIMQHMTPLCEYNYASHANDRAGGDPVRLSANNCKLGGYIHYSRN